MKKADHIAFQPDQLLYEDNHLFIINKLPGQLVQTDDDQTEIALEDEIKNYLRIVYKKEGEAYLGVIHRLDRPVSGVCAFAKTSKMLERMNKLFSTREVEKIYLALTYEKPDKEEGTLKHWMEKDRSKNLARALDKDKPGRSYAELSYTLIGGINGKYVLEVRPKTGRSHQIRAQLAAIGCPLVGDIKYGAAKRTHDLSIGLHAFRLNFVHPVRKEPFSVTAIPPVAQWWDDVEGLITSYYEM